MSSYSLAELTGQRPDTEHSFRQPPSTGGQNSSRQISGQNKTILLSVGAMRVVKFGSRLGKQGSSQLPPKNSCFPWSYLDVYQSILGCQKKDVDSTGTPQKIYFRNLLVLKVCMKIVFCFPQGVVFSEILNKHIELVMTKRGARLGKLTTIFLVFWLVNLSPMYGIRQGYICVSEISTSPPILKRYFFLLSMVHQCFLLLHPFRFFVLIFHLSYPFNFSFPYLSFFVIL
jgi:hypothetical protein